MARALPRQIGVLEVLPELAVLLEVDLYRYATPGVVRDILDATHLALLVTIALVLVARAESVKNFVAQGSAETCRTLEVWER